MVLVQEVNRFISIKKNSSFVFVLNLHVPTTATTKEKEKRIIRDGQTNFPVRDRFRRLDRDRRCASDSSNCGDDFVSAAGGERRD